MISQNQVEGLPMAMKELDQLKSVEIGSVPNADIDAIFDNDINEKEE